MHFWRGKAISPVLFFTQRLGLPIRSIPLVLEGGNFLSNGDGVAVATNRLFDKNQEYEFTEVQIATMLNDYLGGDLRAR
ncbi:MAG: agmatine deiminase family protein [Verrucomicrobiales bacterium]|nr:agmatine deiminase family protein [Verrucomicrobiales bacterium]